MNTVEVKLKTIIKNCFPDYDTSYLQTDTSLVDGIHLDSLGILRMVVEIENEFKISLDYEDIEIENFENIKAIACVVIKSSNGEYL